MDFCINDTLHLFAAVSVLNIVLYFSTCVKFDSPFSRAAFAMDFSIMTKLFLETAMGSHNWPQDATSNAYVFVCFSCFFYIMAPNMWGTIFLIFGLLSVQSFWDGVRDQVESFLQHSLNYIVVVSDSKAVFAGVILFILVAVGFRLFFCVPIVQDIALATVYGVKVWVAFKLLRIEWWDDEQVCCASDSDSDLCPFWFNHSAEWLVMLTLGVGRLFIGRYVAPQFPCHKDKETDYQPLPHENEADATIEQSTAVEISKAETKKRVSLQREGKPKFKIAH